jgi:Trypsin-like peptidase domain
MVERSPQVAVSDRLQHLSLDELVREVRAREVAQSKAPTEATDFAPNPSLKDVETAAIVEKVQSEQKVIYGVDDRKDVFQIRNEKIRNDADSVVILCAENEVFDNGDGTSTLQTQNFGTSRNLCATEPFRDQPTTGFCSGFLVAPDIIATAGHCVDASNVGTVRFIFGFRMQDATTARTVIKNTEIYRGVNIIGRQEVSTGADWALVRIDRPVSNHRVVRIRRRGLIENDEDLHVIGHPVGLPTKVAGGAEVRDNSPRAFFVANLDTYGGNSGSPVFNNETHRVEGILVRGETDFTSNGTCIVSFRCPNTGCRGEDCTRTTEFAQLLP